VTAGVSSTEAAETVRQLHQQLLDAWNAQHASGMAALFEDDANVVGFDGSQINGRTAVESEMGRIFRDHQTAAYVAKIEEVRFLTPEVALLRAAVGMVPPGQSDLNPAVNAIQSLVAVKRAGNWRIALFQNTPAQFHGRPQLVEQMTAELRQVLRERQGGAGSQAQL
jgi:uncharacterized protein (TIGR02246 family)